MLLCSHTCCISKIDACAFDLGAYTAAFAIVFVGAWHITLHGSTQLLCNEANKARKGPQLLHQLILRPTVFVTAIMLERTTASAGPAAAYVSEDGMMCDLNFAVRSRYAASVSLCLVRQSKDAQSKVGYIEIALDPLLNKTGKTPLPHCMP